MSADERLTSGPLIVVANHASNMAPPLVAALTRLQGRQVHVNGIVDPSDRFATIRQGWI